MGPASSAVDATAFGMIASLLAPVFRSDIKDYAESKPNLVKYRDRLLREYYPSYAARRAA